LILTAIVIGFGVQAFALVLLKRAYQTVGADDLDDMKATDREVDDVLIDDTLDPVAAAGGPAR